jgi:hypothetical protein
MLRRNEKALAMCASHTKYFVNKQLQDFIKWRVASLANVNHFQEQQTRFDAQLVERSRFSKVFYQSKAQGHSKGDDDITIK